MTRLNLLVEAESPPSCAKTPKPTATTVLTTASIFNLSNTYGDWLVMDDIGLA